MSTKRARTIDYWDRVRDAGKEEAQQILLLNKQIRQTKRNDLRSKKRDKAEEMLEKKFQELIRIENEDPLDRTQGIYEEFAKTRYIESNPDVYFSSWDRIALETVRQVCALVQMCISTEMKMSRGGHVAYFPPLFRFRYVESSTFCFVCTSTSVELNNCDLYNSHTTLILGLKDNFHFGNGSGWFERHRERSDGSIVEFPEEEIYIDLEKIAQDVFLSLVPHLPGDLINIVCQYVHYSKDPDAFLETVKKLYRSAY